MLKPVNKDHLSANVVIPETPEEPIELYIDHAALCVAVVEREGVRQLAPDWDVPGAYILLDRPGAIGTWGSYVGKAPAGIRSRLLNHVNDKDHWSRAVLIRRDTKYGFHSAQVGWLEGRLYDLLHAAELAQLHNKNRPEDMTLPPHDRQMLESCVMPIVRVLRLLGYDPATPGETPSVKVKTTRMTGSTKQKVYGTVGDLLAAGLLDAETKIVSTNGAWPAEALVLASGMIEYDGRAYSAPSAAASQITGGSVNGWAFWAIETDTGRVTLSTLRARLPQNA
ncbi:hypothetical protein [Actinocorallia longicatena]|uniref:RAMA domain-containing protein n=1 Tax=Actinocorallia longicatena TaxID=111803 RepID=A0ABP6QM19_9ACTN